MTPTRYYLQDHSAKGFEYPTNQEFIDHINAANERGIMSDEMSYILRHLVNTLIRDDEEQAAESETVCGEMFSGFYAWVNMDVTSTDTATGPQKVTCAY